MRWIIHAIERFFPDTPLNLIKVRAKQKYEEIHADPDYFKRFSQNNVKYNFNKFGICALTPKPNNLLMWAHYAKNHEGFCVGIDSGILYEIQQNLAKQHKPVVLLKIKYSKKMPDINFFQSMLSNDFKNHILQLLTSKSTHWEYEDEYRLMLYDHVNTSLDIGHDAINKIILGCEISDINKDKILRIVRELDCNIPVFQSRKGQFKYEVKFEMIDL